MSEHLLPRERSNLREPIFFVLRVHCLNLFPRRRTKDLDDFDKLIDSALSWENWLAKHKLRNDAADRPDVNSSSVVRVSKDQFWRPVVPRTDVRYVWLALHELLGTAEVAELKHVRLSVAKNILRLDVSVANTLGVNVGDRPHKLVRIQLNDKWRNHLLHFKVLLHHSVGGVWNVVHHDVEVDLVGFVAVRVEALPHLHAVRVMQHLQDGQLSVLVSLVLEYFLDGHCLSRLGYRCLEHNTKRSISDDFLGVVSHAL